MSTPYTWTKFILLAEPNIFPFYDSENEMGKTSQQNSDDLQ